MRDFRQDDNNSVGTFTLEQSMYYLGKATERMLAEEGDYAEPSEDWVD